MRRNVLYQKLWRKVMAEKKKSEEKKSYGESHIGSTPRAEQWDTVQLISPQLQRFKIAQSCSKEGKGIVCESTVSTISFQVCSR